MNTDFDIDIVNTDTAVITECLLVILTESTLYLLFIKAKARQKPVILVLLIPLACGGAFCIQNYYHLYMNSMKLVIPLHCIS